MDTHRTIMNTHCRYCQVEFAMLPIKQYSDRRVQCGAPACKAAHVKEMYRLSNAAAKVRREANPPPVPVHVEPPSMHRTWGELTIPSNQAPLTKAMMGQVVHCPGCGKDHPVPSDQRLACVQCRSVWTISWGKKDNGDVLVARMDRWR